MNFKTRISILLDIYGMSQKDLARRISEVSGKKHYESMVSRCLTGKNQPSVAFVMNAAKVFGVSTDFLLGMPRDSQVINKENEVIKIFREENERLLNSFTGRTA